MKRPIYYIYNPETDNFERVFPSIKGRIWGFLRIGCLSLLIGIGLYFVIFYSFEAPTEQNLRKENAILKSQYNILNRRLANSLKVDDIVKSLMFMGITDGICASLSFCFEAVSFS